MPRAFKSAFICTRCGGRLYHAFSLRDTAGRFFCESRCYRKHVRDQRRVLRRLARKTARSTSVELPACA